MRNRAGSLCNQLCFVVENIYQVLLHFLILLKVTQKELHVGELIYLLHPTIQIVKFYPVIKFSLHLSCGLCYRSISD